MRVCPDELKLPLMDKMVIDAPDNIELANIENCEREAPTRGFIAVKADMIELDPLEIPDEPANTALTA